MHLRSMMIWHIGIALAILASGVVGATLPHLAKV
jgi:hypothetical protein